jgi:GDP-4-dehydro-6-deoxy-D-mannose reductase
MRVLVTGANGFVGPHLVQSLRSRCPAATEILLTARQPREDAVLGPMAQLDVTDRDAVTATIARFRCSHVVHLAGLAAITAANANPQAAWRVHVEGTLNIAAAITQQQPDCALIFVGSGQVYGTSARSGVPVDERTLLDPVDNYSVTKAAADLALGALAKQGLRCIRMRPFNHTGPGQSESFVVSSFAMQIARIEAGLQPPVIRVGNLAAERDFLDVRDVASAYVLALFKASELVNGQILNVASGTTQSIRSILDKLIGLSRLQIAIEQDASRMRANDLPRIVGDATAARRLLGWAPAFSLDQTLDDLLQDCRARVASQGCSANAAGS